MWSYTKNPLYNTINSYFWCGLNLTTEIQPFQHSGPEQWSVQYCTALSVLVYHCLYPQVAGPHSLATGSMWVVIWLPRSVVLCVPCPLKRRRRQLTVDCNCTVQYCTVVTVTVSVLLLCFRVGGCPACSGTAWANSRRSGKPAYREAGNSYLPSYSGRQSNTWCYVQQQHSVQIN